jgi:hypothetical protein
MLWQSLQWPMIAALMMETDFQLHQSNQAMGHSRCRQDELRRPFRQFRAAQESGAGDTRKKRAHE